PTRDRISMQICKPRLIKKICLQRGRMVDLSCPCASRVPPRHAWRARTAHRVLWIVVIKPIEVYSEHQRLPGGELVVQASIEEPLAVMTGVGKIAIRRQ